MFHSTAIVLVLSTGGVNLPGIRVVWVGRVRVWVEISARNSAYLVVIDNAGVPGDEEWYSANQVNGENENLAKST